MNQCHVNTQEALKDEADDTLVQLVYVSSITLKSRMNMSIFDDIEAQASEHNKLQQITGILCYGSGQFLQCIEGSKQKILELQRRIFSDKRHKDLKVLMVRKITNRAFSDWRMRSLFLERWLWSPNTKAQADALSSFLPFHPRGWGESHTLQFLQAIQGFQHQPHARAAGITYNAFGNMVQHVAAPHQAFLLVQGVLTILIALALMWMFF